MSDGVAFERFLNSIDQMNANRAHSSEIKDEQKRNARNLSEKLALRKALAQFDPNHPLLKDEDLRTRIHNESARVYDQNKSTWEDIGAVGTNFSYPYTPPATDEKLAERVAQLEAENIQNYVEKHALRNAVRTFDLKHPLVWPKPEESPLIAALRKAGLMAYTFSKNYAAVAEVAQTFPYPEVWHTPKENILEAYVGETEALERRLAHLRNPKMREMVTRLKAQEKGAPQ